jgi:predicted Zn-dependent protease
MKILPPCLLPGFVLAAALLAGCQVVPETGRRQLMLVSPAAEARAGLAAFADIKKKEKISADPAANAQVKRVGQRIAESVGERMPGTQWEFVVFESADANAFALPGGKVGVYTGLLKLVGSDDELAAVMGHEIAHVSTHHGGERMSQNLAVAMGGALLVVGMEQQEVSTARRNQILAAYGLGTTVGVLLPFSRAHETEADRVGLQFAAGAGYDPRAAAVFWRKMSAQGGAKPPEVLSTHPSDQTRIAALEAIAPQFLGLYQARKTRYE